MSRQQIETVEQMRQLPHGTILRELGTRHGDTGYTFTHSAALPAEVLYRPDEDAQ